VSGGSPDEITCCLAASTTLPILRIVEAEIGIEVCVPINYLVGALDSQFILRKSSTMSNKGSKRGRPPGSSQYAREDRELLERMYILSMEGKPDSTAADIAVAEMERPRPSRAQAIERLRKKFPRFRAKKDAENASRSMPREPQAWEPPSAQVLDQLRQSSEFLRTPEGQALIRSAKEHARWVAENKDLLRDVAAAARWTRKP
jgi:hypothetical protein